MSVDPAGGRPYTRAEVSCDDLPGRCDVAKILRCGDLIPDCDTVIVGKDVDEVFAKAEEHARKAHNMMIIPPSVMSQIEAAIKDKA